MDEYRTKNSSIYFRLNNFNSNKQTLCFVHGLSGSSSAWSRYEDYFKNNYNILTFDLRGHGKSKKYLENNDYEIAKFAEDLHSLLVELDIKKIILIGHSFGSLIALDFSLKYPEYISSLILLSSNYCVEYKWLRKILLPIIPFARFIDTYFAEKEGRHINYEDYIGTGDWNVRRMFADILNTNLAIYLKCTINSCDFNCGLGLKKIFAPTLIIHGSKDSIFPIKNATEMHDRIKNSKFIVLNNSDHIIVLNNFPEIVSEINLFLKA